MEIVAAPPPLAQATEEETLIVRAQAGDTDAFGELYRRYRDAIFNYLYRATYDPELANDLTQDTMAKAWKYIGRTAPGLKVRAWLFRIATNILMDQLRRLKVAQFYRWDQCYTGDGADTPVVRPGRGAPRVPLLVAPPDEQPEAAVCAAERVREVQHVLAGLPPHYRFALRSYYYEGERSYDEMAEAHGTTQAAVKMLLYRARQQFAAEWERQEKRAVRPLRPLRGQSYPPEVRAAVVAVRGTMNAAAAARRFGISPNAVRTWWAAA